MEGSSGVDGRLQWGRWKAPAGSIEASSGVDGGSLLAVPTSHFPILPPQRAAPSHAAAAYTARAPRLLTKSRRYCSTEHVHLGRLQQALERLGAAMAEVDAILRELRAHPDPLASHICVSRRHYRDMSDTKSGKRHALQARLTYEAACTLGFRGTLGEWIRLLRDHARQ
jgi:hypothetical protein